MAAGQEKYGKGDKNLKWWKKKMKHMWRFTWATVERWLWCFSPPVYKGTWSLLPRSGYHRLPLDIKQKVKLIFIKKCNFISMLFDKCVYRNSWENTENTVKRGGQQCIKMYHSLICTFVFHKAKKINLSNKRFLIVQFSSYYQICWPNIKSDTPYCNNYSTDKPDHTRKLN